MINIVLILIALAVVAILVLASRQPDVFSVTRTGSISAPASAIFPHVNDLHKWEAWSPWAKLDPNAKNAFAGPEEGVGANMSWVGNNKVGVGGMTITESRPSEFIQFKLEFQKPMQSTSVAEFTFKPDGDKTTITWMMTGTNNFMGKVMSVFMSCEKMAGGQFEKGLASLKEVVEGTK
jgi:hypothetical protein